MCGRFTLTSDAEALARHFHLGRVPVGLVPRYNIAPGQDVAIIREVEGIGRVLDTVHWGLVPGWAEDDTVGRRLINARGETVAQKPAFRDAFHKRRCLVPANGFYEWQQTEQGKQPYWIGLEGAGLLAFAGLWEHWDRPDGSGIFESCALLTVQANRDMVSIHERMPVMLAPEHYAQWLDPLAGSQTLLELIRQNDQVRLIHYPVSRAVNSPLKDNEGLLHPVGGVRQGEA